VVALAHTPFGPVRGTERQHDGARVLHFGGVPYARAARFGLPEPCEWTDELDATRPGAAPPQTIGGLDLVPGMAPDRQSEDCLTAEIFSPDLGGAAPVLVWVPGGSYRIGGAGLATYDGAALTSAGSDAGSEGGVVVVGLNYRLGALGWLGLEGVPTNLGLRDLRAALDWVRVVAPSFGGDPERIVVMGESAGSGMLAHALATGDLPVAGAILQSGAPAGTLDTDAVAWVAEQFLDAAGAADVEGLRRLSVDALLAAQEATVATALPKVGMMPFHPWIDGDLLTGPAHTSAFPAIPLVVGTTAHEMELFRDQVPQLPEEHALGFLDMKALTLGIADPEAVHAAFLAGGSDLVESVADLELHVPNEMLARAHEARGNPVYRYRFTWEAPVKRACHALDLPFTFGTLDVSTWREFAGAQGANAAAADALSGRMRAAWARFATTGAPWNGTELVQFGPADGSGPDAVSERVDLWIGAK